MHPVLLELIRAEGRDDILITGGGIIPREDVDTLQELLYGVHALISVHFRKEEDIQLPAFDAAPPEVAGDTADPAVLIQAHIARASLLVVAVPDAFSARQMIATATTSPRATCMAGAYA